MNVLDYIKNNVTYLDGGMGSLLQARGLMPGELPERWNLTHPDEICAVHRAYFDAGTNIVLTDTFGAYLTKFDEKELEQIIFAAVANARRAASESSGMQEKFVALDMGPIGRLLKPFGDYDFEEAVRVYSFTARVGAGAGADLVFIETMNDSLDTKAALLAVKENTELPVFVSNAYGADGKLMTGATPAAMIAMLEGMRADAVGVNCSLGPKQLAPIVEDYLELASVPVLVKPNAGLPRSVDGRTVYDLTPDEFAEDIADFIGKGVHLCGGCCGTTPEFIAAVCRRTKGMEVKPVSQKQRTVVSSYTHAVEFKGSPVLIGERINPTGKKRFKEALRAHDIDYILQEGLTQQDRGAHILDVNVGLPEIDEPALLKEVTYELQAVIDLPLQIDTTDITAMEAALRIYNGKPMINSVNGKEEVMRAIFPLVRKYGGLVVCLTLDEDGIPESADRRVEIARHIIEVAAQYGIGREDLIFDTLAMTVSADTKAALATLSSLKTIKHDLGCHTSLGVSNVSFGLPAREVITSAFFAAALENGLSAAIMNPNSAEMMKVYYSYRALHDLDANCLDYISNIERYVSVAAAGAGASTGGTQGNAGTFGQAGAQGSADTSGQTGSQGDAAQDTADALSHAVIRGMKDRAAAETVTLLESMEPLEIVNTRIIPALDTVGQRFEAKTMYLPQLLMAAEAAQSAFTIIKERMSGSGETGAAHGPKYVIATVQGDIHDIGKNIVKLILENYGFDVMDLGKDVAPEKIVEAVVAEHVPFVGLSALMTTTVPAMEETIKQLRVAAPWAKVTVGGAVLTQEYSDRIGADFYASDAMATVRYAMQQNKQ